MASVVKNFRNYVVAGDWIRLDPPYALVSIPARVASVLKSFRNYVQHTSQMLHQLNPLGLLELTFNPCFHPFLTWTGGLAPATKDAV